MIQWTKFWNQAGVRNGLIALIVSALVFFWLYWGKFDRQITGFFRIGSILPLSPLLDPQGVLIYEGELGYDGQQFLSLALDPLLQEEGTLAALDLPAYRYRRILYPLLGNLLGLGSPQLIPWALVGINILAIVALIVLATWYYKGHRQASLKALWGLAIPGIWLSLAFSTADLLAGVFTLGALYSEHRRRPWLCALALGLGLLTRETLLLVWLALALNALYRRRLASALPLALALVPALLWNLYVVSLGLPGGKGGGNFGWPLAGMGVKFLSLAQGGLTPSNLYEAFMWALFLGGFALGIWGCYAFPSHNRSAPIALHLYLGLALVSSSLILNYYLNYARVFLDVYVLGLLLIHDFPRPQKSLYFGACGLASLAFLILQS